MKTKKVGKSKKVSPARKAPKRPLGKKKISSPKRILKDAHRPNHFLFDKLSKLNRRDFREMEIDYLFQSPDAAATNIPEDAYRDPVTCEQLRYDSVERKAILVSNYQHGKALRTGRQKGSLDKFSHILDSVIMYLKKEGKNLSAWAAFCSLYDQQGNHKDDVTGKPLYSVDKGKRLISFEGRKKPMDYKTFCNRFSDAKVRSASL